MAANPESGNRKQQHARQPCSIEFLRKTVAIANEQFAGTAGVPIPKAQTISWNDLVPRMPAAIFLGDDGDSR
jgi:hypothetical protein